MQIIDTYDEIRKCFPNGKFSMGQWEAYADRISPEFKSKMKQDSENYDFSNDILPVMNHLISNQSQLDLAHTSFIHLTNGLSEKVKTTLKTELHVTIVFCLGLCNGAGWATKLDGRNAVLLGAEKIVELSWCSEKDMSGLIYHELGHVWHSSTRRDNFEAKDAKEESLWRVYEEGVAMHIEQMICGDATFYHQDKNGWKSWCKERKTRLFSEYLRRVRCSESVDQFFGDWCRFEGVPDVGYFLGGELINYMSKDRSLDEIANFKMEEVEAAIEELAIEE